MSKQLVALAICVTLLSSAHASLQEFADRSSWSAAAGGAPDFFENFNGYAFDVPFGHSPAIFGGGFSLHSTGEVGSSQSVMLSLGTDIDGSRHARMFVNTDEPTTVRMDFVTPVRAWGADIGGVEDFGELAVVDVYFQGESAVGASLNLDDGFIGFVTSPPRAVTSLIFRSGSFIQGPVGQPFGVDNIAGFTIPEPGSFSMLLVCCVAVLGTTHRRQRRNGSA